MHCWRCQHARMLRCSHPSCDRHAKAHRLDTAWCSAGSLICDYSTSTRWPRERACQAGGLYRAAATSQSVYKLWKDHHKLQSKTCSRLHASLQAGPDFIRHRHEPHPSLVHRAAGARARDLVLAERPPSTLSTPRSRANAGAPRIGAWGGAVARVRPGASDAPRGCGVGAAGGGCAF